MNVKRHDRTNAPRAAAQVPRHGSLETVHRRQRWVDNFPVEANARTDALAGR